MSSWGRVCITSRIPENHLIEKYATFYTSLVETCSKLSRVMVGFERGYLIDTQNKSIEFLVFRVLEESASKHRQKLHQLGTQLLLAIERDREGQKVKREYIFSVCRFMKKIGYYESEFKTLFLEYADEFYRKYLNTKTPIQDLLEYTHTISNKMTEERNRCEYLFDEDLAQILHFIMKKILIDSVITQILNSSFVKLLVEGKSQELKFYYDSMKDNETFDLFIKFFYQTVKNQVESFISAREGIIENLHKFYTDISNTIRQVYNDEVRIKIELDRSIEQVISKRDAIIAKYFSNCISSNMERGVTQSSAKDVQAKIEDYMKLFKFIQNKKAFITAYNQK